MLIYRTVKLVNDELIEGSYFLNLCDAKANLEKRNEREEKLFQKWKLAHSLRGKPYKSHPDRWRIEEIYVLE